MTRQEIVRRSQAKRRERLKAAGKCIQCGADPKPGRTLCPVCMAKQVKYSMRYKAKNEQGRSDKALGNIFNNPRIGADYTGTT